MHDLTTIALFARRYTAAWCSQDPASVASFFSLTGSLTVNEGPPALGPAAITEVARSFMVAFPDLRVTMDDLLFVNGHPQYHWTLTGAYAANGNPVRISGFEIWELDPNGLIASSEGHFDAIDYDRQLGRGRSAV